MLREIDNATKAFPNAYIRMCAFDASRQVQVASMLVHRPASAKEWRPYVPSFRAGGGGGNVALLLLFFTIVRVCQPVQKDSAQCTDSAPMRWSHPVHPLLLSCLVPAE